MLDPEMDAFHNASGEGYHANYAGLVNLSHTLFSDKVTGAVELWSEVNDDPSGAITEASFDVAVSWLALSNLQLDAGTNIGLNDKTPDMQSYIGISQRF